MISGHTNNSKGKETAVTQVQESTAKKEEAKKEEGENNGRSKEDRSKKTSS